MSKLNIEEIVLSSGKCECGCGQDAPLAMRTNRRLGHVKGQPLRFVSGHNKRHSSDLSRYSIDANGCWIWLGAKGKKGYGRSQVDGEHTGAHRAIYEARFGKLPRHIHLDHRCKNTSCVNPDHLIPKSASENSADTCRRKLTLDMVTLVHKSSASSSSMARLLGVARQTVADVRHGRRWRHASAMIDATE